MYHHLQLPWQPQLHHKQCCQFDKKCELDICFLSKIRTLFSPLLFAYCKTLNEKSRECHNHNPPQLLTPRALHEHLRAHKAVSYLSNSIFIMNFICRLLFLYLGKKIEHLSTINRNTEKQANGMLINTYPRFSKCCYT